MPKYGGGWGDWMTLGRLRYNGICPVCRFDRMLMHDDRWVKLDACPKCGFGYGEKIVGDWTVKMKNGEVWEHVHDGYKLVPTEEALTRRKCLDWALSVAPQQSNDRRTVYDYSDAEIIDFAVMLGRIRSDKVQLLSQLRAELPSELHTEESSCRSAGQ